MANGFKAPTIPSVSGTTNWLRYQQMGGKADEALRSTKKANAMIGAGNIISNFGNMLGDISGLIEKIEQRKAYNTIMGTPQYKEDGSPNPAYDEIVKSNINKLPSDQASQMMLLLSQRWDNWNSLKAKREQFNTEQTVELLKGGKVRKTEEPFETTIEQRDIVPRNMGQPVVGPEQRMDVEVQTPKKGVFQVGDLGYFEQNPEVNKQQMKDLSLADYTRYYKETSPDDKDAERLTITMPDGSKQERFAISNSLFNARLRNKNKEEGQKVQIQKDVESKIKDFKSQLSDIRSIKTLLDGGSSLSDNLALTRLARGVGREKGPLNEGDIKRVFPRAAESDIKNAYNYLAGKPNVTMTEGAKALILELVKRSELATRKEISATTGQVVGGYKDALGESLLKEQSSGFKKRYGDWDYWEKEGSWRELIKKFPNDRRSLDLKRELKKAEDKLMRMY